MTHTIHAAILALALTSMPHVQQETDAKWQRIADAHGSSLDVPTKLLQRERDPAMLVFVAGDGTRITFDTITESRPGFPGNDPEGDMALGRAKCTVWPPAYRVVTDRLAAYSCAKGDAIVYYAARYNGSGSVTLLATYPKAHAATWDKAVARMSTSMRQLARIERRP